MSTRLELQSKLEELLESRNVYYQPPPSKQINYPAIVYSRSGTRTFKANNKKYLAYDRYTVTVISKTVDHQVIKKILNEFDHCEYDRPYVADNLYHDVLTLYL